MDAVTRARHDANRAELVAAILALEARYAREDEALADARRVERERHDAGLEAHDAMIEAAGVRVIRETLEPDPEPPVTFSHYEPAPSSD